MAKKIRVAVLFGGRSVEHEIALRSAASIMQGLDCKKYSIVPIKIDKSGKWQLQEKLPSLDVIFPVLHGTFGEDGTMQGLFDLAEVAYVGSGVLGSAIGMDKDVAKRLAQAAGIDVVPYILVRNGDALGTIGSRVKKELGFPVFVKPANLGSSVGVTKVKDQKDLKEACLNAFAYDEKILIEKAIDCREIEVAVLGGHSPESSVPGEIIPNHEFYSYEAKYLDENGARFEIPAKLGMTLVRQAQNIAERAFVALECYGMARVDLFLDKKTNRFYFNELNTIPGFTSISMYPKLWEASCIPFSKLLDRLIDLAQERHRHKKNLRRSYTLS